MVEMTEAANILHNATERSFVLMDEIGRGTSTFDGLSLAWACAHHIAKKNRAFTLFATHYFELTRLAVELPAVANVHLDAVEHGAELIFLHALRDGPANQSYGLQVARIAGVPLTTVNNAKRYLRALEQHGGGTDRSPQVTLDFSAPEIEEPAESHPLLDELAALDPDSLTPREALQALYALKEKLPDDHE
jgi:DNA mismatch repair protein MutS